ncbi:ABC transporter substrate-binding protein [Paracoccus sp. SCSIO 75233]|uniref:ABC transporter substrate-binding protein n=1 Tax=Paracoccus sp. SCSIO 75233 TaxID=3017782 RepID=UPI0022F086A8|nr:ABC transporter substrate-binding protein [Paracoccus sp. SCSIO 75233]WBU52400.1 ABC transporter substrate-binding protein [Paracoccus sp. SCSIO 75233]
MRNLLQKMRMLVAVAALSTAMLLPASPGQAQDKVSVGLIAPMSGLYARFGQLMEMGAKMAIEDINAAGGIQSLGGAQLDLVVIDTGDSTDKAKAAAQRMVADYPDIVAATGSYLSSFTLAVTEVTERAKLPVLTLSYSNLITERGFEYVFQTSAPGNKQAGLAIPIMLDLAEEATGKRPTSVGIISDNTAASSSLYDAMTTGGLLAANNLELSVGEVFTPPLVDATSLIQKLRARKPDVIFLLPTVVSDIKLVLEKMKELRVDIPIVSFGSTIGERDMIDTVGAERLEGVIFAAGNFGFKGHEDLVERMSSEFNEPWMTQNAISTYGDMFLLKQAIEEADEPSREAVAEALRNLRGGPAKYYPGGELAFDEAGRRIDASVVIVQWIDGVPQAVFPESLAVTAPKF